MKNDNFSILGDYHTHTLYSGDAFSTLEENVKSAISKGLKEIAVTDHGFLHRQNGISRENFAKELDEVKALREKYPEIHIYQSIEADILGENGTLDLTENDMQNLDFLMMGYHMTSQAETKSQRYSFKIPNLLPIFRATKKRIEKNTLAYLKCIEKYPLSFVNHLNYAMNVDVRPIAKLCKETNTMIELNGKRVFFSQKEVDILLEEGVDFITNSDAHRYAQVGNVNLSMNYAEKHGIPFDRIKNINQLPKLKLLHNN